MKKRLPTLILAIIFLLGAGIFTYPVISEYWNHLHQSEAVAAYQETVDEITDEENKQVWKDVKAYNETIQENTFIYDTSSQEEKNLRGTEYWSVLNVNDNGIMGYLYIPKADITLPIYHGTSESVLQIGAGHMYGTSLPIGGKGTHCVIAGHRGLPSAKLFTDIDQLEKGDVFYLYVLDQILTYEVDQISDMIKKDDTERLTQLMQQVDGEDYVTLFTCTPYGINSHRLLIRGHRIETSEAKLLFGQTSVEFIPIIPFMVTILVLLLILIRISAKIPGKRRE